MKLPCEMVQDLLPILLWCEGMELTPASAEQEETIRAIKKRAAEIQETEEKTPDR